MSFGKAAVLLVSSIVNMPSSLDRVDCRNDVVWRPYFPSGCGSCSETDRVPHELVSRFITPSKGRRLDKRMQSHSHTGTNL